MTSFSFSFSFTANHASSRKKASSEEKHLQYQMVTIPELYYPLSPFSSKSVETFKDIFQFRGGIQGLLKVSQILNIETPARHKAVSFSVIFFIIKETLILLMMRTQDFVLVGLIKEAIVSFSSFYRQDIFLFLRTKYPGQTPHSSCFQSERLSRKMDSYFHSLLPSRLCLQKRT